MGSNFYYFCSQLPALGFPGRLPFSTSEFLEEADRLLSESDAAELRRCAYPPVRDPAGPAAGVYAKFRAWNFALEGEVARFRVAEHSTKAVAYGELPPETDSFAYLKEELANAARSGNPLERERQLDLIRWRKLDDLGAGRDFSFDAVVLYRLKLALLEKHARFVAETGAANFEEAVAEIDKRSEA